MKKRVSLLDQPNAFFPMMIGIMGQTILVVLLQQHLPTFIAAQSLFALLWFTLSIFVNLYLDVMAA